MAKVYLFDGTTLDQWYARDTDGAPIAWKNEDGILVVEPETHDIVSKFTFGDAHIHVEWREPDMPWATGQGKGNSGVFVHGCYEIQVLDSYGIENIQLDDCGAIYKMHLPRVNACKPPLEWQTYDIYVRAPRFNEDGTISENGRMTVIQNGICIHNNVELYDVCPAGITDEKQVAKGSLMLQDHGDPVAFRNIWVEEL